MCGSGWSGCWRNWTRWNCNARHGGRAWLRNNAGNAAGYVTVEIYDQTYHLSGQDAEHIRELAELRGRQDARRGRAGPHGGLAARGRAGRAESGR